MIFLYFLFCPLLSIVYTDFYIKFWVVHQTQFWWYSLVNWKSSHYWKSVNICLICYNGFYKLPILSKLHTKYKLTHSTNI
jgi:hypothetical protein